MSAFDKTFNFAFYFISAMIAYVSARNLDKCLNTDYISDILIIFLITCVLTRVITLEELNNKQDKN